MTRTQQIPVERRAESAVIAWLRHAITAYDNIRIALVKGKRRKVRRMLGEQSRRLLEEYRVGDAVNATHCPSPRDWKLVLETYGFKDETEALTYGKNPVDNLEPLAKAGVPLLHVYGDADEVVPWDENTGVIAQRYPKRWLVWSTSPDFAAELGPAWENVCVRTLRNTFFNRPGKLYCTPTSVILYFDREFCHQDDLVPLVDRINAEQHRIPWMGNRLLVLSVCPDGAPRAGP